MCFPNDSTMHYFGRLEIAQCKCFFWDQPEIYFWLICGGVFFIMLSELRLVKWVRFFEWNWIVKGVIFLKVFVNFEIFYQKYLKSPWYNRSTRPKVFCEKSLLKNFHNIHKKALVLELRLQHKCFSVNFAKFLRTISLKKTSEPLSLILQCFSFHFILFNRDLNRGCLIYMFPLRLSGVTMLRK